jgi:hypothetical protein
LHKGVVGAVVYVNKLQVHDPDASKPPHYSSYLRSSRMCFKNKPNFLLTWMWIIQYPCNQGLRYSTQDPIDYHTTKRTQWRT